MTDEQRDYLGVIAGRLEYSVTTRTAVAAALAEIDRLREAMADATQECEKGKEDGAGQLCQALYGRKAKPRDYLGGSDARMLFDAAKEIERLRVELARAKPC